MKGQFKNPLPGNSRSTPETDDRLDGSKQPAAPDDQSSGNISPAGQMKPKRGLSLVLPPWPDVQELSQHHTPYPSSMADQATIKQPSLEQGILSLPGSGRPPTGQLTPNLLNLPASGRPPTGQLLPNQGPLSQSAPTRPPTGQLLPNQGPVSTLGTGRPPTGQLFPNQAPVSLVGGPLAPGLVQNRPPTGTLGAGPGPAVLTPGSSFSLPNSAMVAPPLAPPFNPNNPSMRPGRVVDRPSPRITRDLTPGSGKKPGEKRKKHRRVPIWARVVMTILVMMIVGLGSVYWYYEANYANSLGNIIGQSVPRAAGEKDPNAGRSGDILSGDRINILLLGSDTDQKFDMQDANGQTIYLAQTDIVITIDPASKSVGMLSIPRDLYIPVPGNGLRKLDEAYSLGGVDLSRLTLYQDFGITINYYAWVGLDGFIKVINEVGGVDVDVLHPIVDDNYPDDIGDHGTDLYAYKRLYLAPGPQHLDGPSALEYVRSRHADLVGDFGRSVRQQQVLSALKTKLANPDIFNKLPAIANDMTGYLKTDMQLPDVLKLMTFARDLDVNKMNKLVLGPPYSNSGTAPAGTPDAGQSVVFPNCTQITPAIQSFLSLGESATCAGQASNSNSNGGVATTTGQQGSPLAASLTGGSSNPSLSDMLGTASASLGSGPAELYGVRALLTLMMLGVFESAEPLNV